MAVIIGTDEYNFLSGGPTGDEISGAGGPDTIHGEAGNDTLYGATQATRYDDVEYDVFDAGEGDDRIFAGVGDRILGRDGDDQAVLSYRGVERPALYFDGGQGFDSLTLDAQAPDEFKMYVVAMDEMVSQYASADLKLFSVERLDLGRLSGAHVVGGMANDHITVSHAGGDIVDAGAGDDTVVMRIGRNSAISGGEGQDTLSFEGITHVTQVPNEWGLMIKLHETGPQAFHYEAYVLNPWPVPGVPTSWGYRPVGSLSIESFEHFIGSSLRDDVEGSEVGNRLDGRGGADELSGLGGADTLLGGQGNDTLDGGEGDDQLFGEDDADRLSGGAGHDTISGGGARDVLMGDAGNDSLIGGVGNDTLLGGDGNDTLDGGGDTDVIDGGAGDDFIDAHVNNPYGTETLSGGTGNDTIIGGPGGGSLRGGAGADRIVGTFTSGDRSYSTASYADAAEGVQIDRRLDSSSWTGDAKGDELVNIHQIELSKHADVFYGRGEGSASTATTIDNVSAGDGADTVLGFGGDDRLYGEKGDDSLGGGIGLDQLNGGDGDDWLDGGADADHLYGDGGADTLIAGSGNDYIRDSDGGAPGTGSDSIDGGEGADRILLVDGNDTALGGAGNDEFWGARSGMRLEGGTGDDFYELYHANVTIIEEMIIGGTDSVRLAHGFTGSSYTLAGYVENLDAHPVTRAMQLTGNGEANEIRGGDHNDTISGEWGADTITGGEGNDFIDGGLGGFGATGDMVTYDGKRSDYDIVALENGDLKVTDKRGGYSTDGSDTVRDIEFFRFTDGTVARADLANTRPVARTDQVFIDEDALSDNLWSLLLANDEDADGDPLHIVGLSLSATKGSVVLDTINKTITYTADADVFDDLGEGDMGSDSFVYTIRDKAGAETTATVAVSIRGKQNADDWTKLTEADDDRVFGDGADRVRGLDGNDRILAGGGGDTVEGGAGHDTLDGEAGADHLIGGIGEDRIVGGLGDKVLAGGDGVDTGVFDFSGAQGGISFVLPSSASASVDVQGVTISGFERIEFTAGGGADFLQGGTLADVLRGGGGSDTLVGGGGADQLYGGAGDDNYYVDSTQARVVESAGDGVDTVQTTLAIYALDANVENLAAVISSAGRSFTGNALANRITGGAGADTIDGGTGTDTLFGGAGKDRFVFTSLDGDQIQDWQKGEIIDVLALEAYGLRLTMRTDHTRAEFDLDGDGQFDDGLLIVQGVSVKLTDFDW